MSGIDRMKYILILLLFLIIPVFAEDSSMILKINGSAGAVIIHSDMKSDVWAGNDGFITNGENWNSESYGRQVVTLGDTEYYSLTKNRNDIKNTFDSKQIIDYKDAAVIGSSASMSDNRVNIPDVQCSGGVASADILSSNGTVIVGQNPSQQSVTLENSDIGFGGGTYKDGVVIDDTNITMSVRAESEHGGLISDITTDSEYGFNKSSSMKNFDQETDTHLGFYDINESGYSGGYDFEWTGHENPFKIAKNSTRLRSTNTT
jgi:hypothetical protein